MTRTLCKNGRRWGSRGWEKNKNSSGSFSDPLYYHRNQVYFSPLYLQYTCTHTRTHSHAHTHLHTLAQWPRVLYLAAVIYRSQNPGAIIIPLPSFYGFFIIVFIYRSLRRRISNGLSPPTTAALFTEDLLSNHRERRRRVSILVSTRGRGRGRRCKNTLQRNIIMYQHHYKPASSLVKYTFITQINDDMGKCI